MGTTQGDSHQPAAWRGATPYHSDADRMGVSFELSDGSVIRLAISRESAAHLAQSIVDYLSAGAQASGPCPICWADKVADWISNPEQRSIVRSIFEAHAAQSRSKAIVGEGNPGLFYRREDGVEIALDESDVWLWRLSTAGGWMLERYMGGMIEESHAPMEDAELGIALAAITRGYQPPRILRRLETRSGRTQPEDGLTHGA